MIVFLVHLLEYCTYGSQNKITVPDGFFWRYENAKRLVNVDPLDVLIDYRPEDYSHMWCILLWYRQLNPLCNNAPPSNTISFISRSIARTRKRALWVIPTCLMRSRGYFCSVISSLFIKNKKNKKTGAKVGFWGGCRNQLIWVDGFMMLLPLANEKLQ